MLEQRQPLDNTNVEWTQAQLNLLAKGQKFIPTPKKVDRVQKFKDFLSFARKLRLAIFFYRRSQEEGGGGWWGNIRRYKIPMDQGK